MSTENNQEVRLRVLNFEGDVLFEAGAGLYRRGYAPLPTGVELVQLLATFAGQGAQTAQSVINGDVWREVHRG